MFGFPVFGCRVYLGLDILIASLVLAVALVPAMSGGSSDLHLWALWAAWWIGGTLVAVVIHELAHAAVILLFGLGLRHIYIGVQGGHTALLRIDPPWWQEFLVFFVGPLSNLVSAGAAFFWFAHGADSGWQAGAASLLFWPSLVLGALNLLPFFTMDGGRALRALVLPFSADRRSAATNARFVAALLVAGVLGGLGVTALVAGDWFGFVLLGLGGWRGSAAWKSGRGGEELGTLAMFTVADAMGPGIVVRPDHPARDLLESHVRRRHGAGTYELVPRPYVVMDESGKVFGLLTGKMLSEISGERWDWATLTVAHVMLPAAKVPVVSPGTSTTTALVLLHQGESDGVLVIDDGDLVGVVTLTHLDELLRKQDAA
jgi:CBS domain-containing protein